jgi:hypothetical protein
MMDVTPERIKKNREYQHRYKERHPEKVNAHRANYRKRNRERLNEAKRIKTLGSDNLKKRAQDRLERAVKSGLVQRPDTCPCGRPNPEGHHSDYSKPLMVAWLCHKCHFDLHAKMDPEIFMNRECRKARSETWKS